MNAGKRKRHRTVREPQDTLRLGRRKGRMVLLRRGRGRSADRQRQSHGLSEKDEKKRRGACRVPGDKLSPGRNDDRKW